MSVSDQTPLPERMQCYLFGSNNNDDNDNRASAGI